MAALIHVTAWERKSRFRRIGAAFARVALLIALVAVLIDLLEPPLTIFVMARWQARKMPGVKVVPRPLQDFSLSDSPVTTLSYFGYAFEVPWTTTYKQRASEKGDLVLLDFASGQNLLFLVPGNNDGLLAEISNDPQLHMQNLRFVFGELVNRSPYDQYATLVETTPQSIRAFGLRSEAVRGMALLTIKAIAITPNPETGIFSFNLPDKRGFQIGDPHRTTRVGLEVFDLGGRHLEIFFGTANEKARISQQDVNRVLTSLRSTTDPDTPASSFKN